MKINDDVDGFVEGVGFIYIFFLLDEIVLVKGVKR